MGHIETKGRGYFNLTPSIRVKHISELSVGDIVLYYSHQFDAKNTLKIIDAITGSGRADIRYAVYWDPIYNKRMGNETLAIWDFYLATDEYYKPRHPVPSVPRLGSK